mmetsp:Transcript_519/g.1738  ORF Transcript_519/g.1738 Transcript_519/m.1738 type:complete len:305 (+) Transcript_519:119-1033(+)
MRRWASRSRTPTQVTKITSTHSPPESARRRPLNPSSLSSLPSSATELLGAHVCRLELRRVPVRLAVDGVELARLELELLVHRVGLQLEVAHDGRDLAERVALVRHRRGAAASVHLLPPPAAASCSLELRHCRLRRPLSLLALVLPARVAVRHGLPDLLVGPRGPVDKGAPPRLHAPQKLVRGLQVLLDLLLVRCDPLELLPLHVDVPKRRGANLARLVGHSRSAMQRILDCRVVVVDPLLQLLEALLLGGRLPRGRRADGRGAAVAAAAPGAGGCASAHQLVLIHRKLLHRGAVVWPVQQGRQR